MSSHTKPSHTKPSAHAYPCLQDYQAQTTCAFIKTLCYHLTVPREMQSGSWSISQRSCHLVKAAEQMSSSLKMLALSRVFAVGWRTTETQAMIAVTWSEPLPAVSCPDNKCACLIMLIEKLTVAQISICNSNSNSNSNSTCILSFHDY